MLDPDTFIEEQLALITTLIRRITLKNTYLEVYIANFSHLEIGLETSFFLIFHYLSTAGILKQT